MPILYNPNKKKGVFMIPAGGLGPSVSADFSYSKSSYHQDEADPTPTITGTAGGSFNADAGVVFVDTGTYNSSTGQIDLSASTIDSHIITYTVDGVQSGQTIGITESPYLDNTYSMQFDGINDYIDLGSSIDLGLTNTVSMWLNLDSGYSGAILGESSYGSTGYYLLPYSTGFIVRIGATTAFATNVHTYLTAGSWHHLVVIRSGNDILFYVDGDFIETVTLTTTTVTKFNIIGNSGTGADPIEGKIDELAAWNTALGETAIQEIYNATYNNTGKALDLSTDTGNYTNSSSLQYWNRLGD